jgi:hypothetical protein
MSSNAPKITTGFSFEAHVTRPGAQPAATPMPPESGAISEPNGIGVHVVWGIFRIVVWGTVAVFFAPRVLDYVGGHDIARWLEHHTWVRVVSIPVLLPLWLLSAFQPIDSSKGRKARAELATSVGATLVKTPGLDPTYGLAEGPGLRVPLGPWSMDIVTWMHNSTRRTVARVTVETSTSFSFAAHAASREPALLRGLQQHTMKFALGTIAGQAGDPNRAALAASLAYLGEAPITTGDAVLDRTVVLRANQTDTARALLKTGGVAQAIAAFDQQARNWEWTLQPGATPGLAEMRFECQGGALDAERVHQVQSLMSTALEHLARAGAIRREVAKAA